MAVGELTGVGRETEIRNAGQTLYVAESGAYCGHSCGAFPGRLLIVDVGDPTRPRQVGAVDSTMTILEGLALIGHYAYVGGGSTCGGGMTCLTGAHMDVVDVAEPSRAAAVATVTTGFVDDLGAAGARLFVAELPRTLYERDVPGAYVGRLRLLDASDPIRPIEAAASTEPQQDHTWRSPARTPTWRTGTGCASSAGAAPKGARSRPATRPPTAPTSR